MLWREDVLALLKKRAHHATWDMDWQDALDLAALVPGYFTPEEIAYLRARLKARTLAEAEMLLGLSHRTVYHHVRNTWWKYHYALHTAFLKELELEEYLT